MGLLEKIILTDHTIDGFACPKCYATAFRNTEDLYHCREGHIFRIVDIKQDGTLIVEQLFNTFIIPPRR